MAVEEYVDDRSTSPMDLQFPKHKYCDMHYGDLIAADPGTVFTIFLGAITAPTFFAARAINNHLYYKEVNGGNKEPSEVRSRIHDFFHHRREEPNPSQGPEIAKEKKHHHHF